MIKKQFTAYIGERQYWVYNIEDKKHESLNGEPSTWWLYYKTDEDVKSHDLTTPPIDSPHWLPYQNSINRRCWDIHIVQKNGGKHKWGSTNFSCHTSVEMKCNGKLIYQFGVGLGVNGLSYAMAKAQYLKVQMEEHPYNFFEPETEIGRKIYFYGLPATVEPTSWPGEIKIIPDYNILPREEWWKEYKNRKFKIDQHSFEESECFDSYEEDQQFGSINWGFALEDGNINWFRHA